jgi:hypothetical protein
METQEMEELSQTIWFDLHAIGLDDDEETEYHFNLLKGNLEDLFKALGLEYDVDD